MKRLCLLAATLAALLFLLAAAALAPARPIQAEAAATAAPGELRGISYRYRNPGWRGWPLAPLHQPHYVRGGFLDVRAGYHFGIDISADDSAPEQGAPDGRSQRVYAIDGGTLRARNLARGCHNRRATVGHFSYWHMDPVLPPGSRVRPGQMIGWTCTGEWHLHLSEWQKIEGRTVWVNPLHRGGKLAPYVDRSAPEIDDIAFFTPEQTVLVPGERRAAEAGTRFDLAAPLTGAVQLRVAVADPQLPQGFVGDDSRLLNGIHPYAMRVTIRDAAGRQVFAQRSFRADIQPSSPLGGLLPLLNHYAPGTRANQHAGVCMKAGPELDCRAHPILNALARADNPLGVLETSRLGDGAFTLTVVAADIAGNVGTASTRFCVDNSPAPALQCGS